jgi:hypothetical protein
MPATLYIVSMFVSPDLRKESVPGKIIQHPFALPPTLIGPAWRTRSFKRTLRIRQGHGLDLPTAAPAFANPAPLN